MEENAEEDVNVEVADMTEIDNQEVIELIEGKPGGILSILNEECVVPKGTDGSFAEKLFAQCITNKRLKKPLKKKDAFQISHFAGQVTYTATGILEKNKDPVSEDLLVILKGSDEPAVRQLFTDSPDEAQLMLDRKKGAKFQGVVAKFQQQLAELLAIVESSETHFVRCIKPNLTKAPTVWEDEVVSKQLRCSGIMEAVRVIAAGYPDRVPHSEILGRFAALISSDERPSADKEGEKAAASKTLQLLKLDPKEFGASDSPPPLRPKRGVAASRPSLDGWVLILLRSPRGPTLAPPCSAGQHQDVSQGWNPLEVACNARANHLQRRHRHAGTRVARFHKLSHVAQCALRMRSCAHRCAAITLRVSAWVVAKRPLRSPRFLAPKC